MAAPQTHMKFLLLLFTAASALRIGLGDDKSCTAVAKEDCGVDYGDSQRRATGVFFRVKFA